jgi:hypothetical protein
MTRMRSAANPLSIRERSRDCSFTSTSSGPGSPQKRVPAASVTAPVPIIANKELLMRLAYTTRSPGVSFLAMVYGD